MEQPEPPAKVTKATPSAITWQQLEHTDTMTVVEYQKLVGVDKPLGADVVANWIQLVEYQGFNPRTIANALSARGPSKAQLMVDINKMVVIAMTRGTVLLKIKRSVSEMGAQLLDELVSRYSLVSTGTLGTNRKTAITLARVCACFPVKCVQIMIVGKIKHPDQVANYPPALCFPAAAVLIPKHHVSMRMLYSEWSKAFAQRTTKKGQIPNNDIAMNLLDIGDDYERNCLWNMAAFLINGQQEQVVFYTNGRALFQPEMPPASMKDAIAYVQH